MHRRSLLALAPLLATRPALAAEINVLSAGAVEPGLAAALAGFGAAGGPPVRVAYATAPQLRERMLAGETPDVLVAPLALLAEFGGRLSGPAVPLGKVGVGVAVRPGAPEPAIRDAARCALRSSRPMRWSSTGPRPDSTWTGSSSGWG